MPLLEIEHLTVQFPDSAAPVQAVDDVSLSIGDAQTLCVVGESGCGKSVTALSVAKLLPNTARVSGRILLQGKDVLAMSARELRRVRGGVVSYVFQDPASSLNPVMRVGNQVKEALRLHRPADATDAEVVRLLRLVQIPEPEERIRRYPFQLSGGMQQRVMLAMALASRPRLLIADEPTTALDTTIQAEILALLRHLRTELGMSLLLITHNLGIVEEMGGRLAVMYAGQIVEEGAAGEILREPWHPYTRGLLASVPRLGARSERLSGIPGTVARAGAGAPGCLFAPRCGLARPECRVNRPELREITPGRLVRCPVVVNEPPKSGAPAPEESARQRRPT